MSEDNFKAGYVADDISSFSGHMKDERTLCLVCEVS